MEIEPFNVDVRKNNNFTDRYYHAKKTGTVLEDVSVSLQFKKKYFFLCGCD